MGDALEARLVDAMNEEWWRIASTATITMRGPQAPPYEELWRYHGRRSPRPNRWRRVQYDGVAWRFSKMRRPKKGGRNAQG